MALYNLSGTRTDSINIRIQPDIVELERLNLQLLSALPKFAINQEQIVWDANVGGATAVGESSATEVEDFSEDDVVPAVLGIGNNRFRSSFTIDATEYATGQAAAAAGSPDKFINLIAYKSEGAQREILRKLGSAIFSGTGNAASGGMIGLQTTVSTASSGKSTYTYAGLAPGTYGKWSSIVKTAFGPVSKAKLHAVDVDIRSGKTMGSPSSYNLLVVHPDTATYMHEAFDIATQRNAGARETSDVGFFGLTYKGNPVIEDPNCAADTIHFVDTTQVRLYFFDQSRPEYFGNEVRVDDITMYVKELPSNNPERAKLVMYCKAQLQLRDRMGLATLKGVEAPEEPTPSPSPSPTP